ncbi:MAG: YciI family protein [Armatimonadota bacterium]|nr:YciI family protein [Armatimonadota bacterium]
MRFMMLMYPHPRAESGAMPDLSEISEMMAYNEELVKAGVLLSGEGLHPTSKGARVLYSAGKAAATDGPFTKTKEVIGGFWMIQVQSKDEAIKWASRCPVVKYDSGAMIELRQVFEADDFGPALTPQLKEQEDRLRTQAAAR